MKENFTLRKLLECTWQNKFLKGHISRKIISLNFPANMYTYSFPYNNNAILKFKRVKISRKSIGWIYFSNVHIFPLNPNCSRNFAQRYSLTKTAKLTYCLTCWLTDGRVKTLYPPTTCCVKITKLRKQTLKLATWPRLCL